MSLKFVVMSDLHISASGNGDATIDAFERAMLGMASIARDHPDAAFIALAGDLADEGHPEDYSELAKVIEAAPLPVYATLGNHDDRAAYLAHFGPQAACETGHTQKAVHVGGQCVILLDTSEPGQDAGFLCGDRIDWLRQQLSAAKDMPVSIVMHHPPNPMQTSVDRIGLTDRDAFWEALKVHDDVRHIIAGHVHLTTSATMKGVGCTTVAGNTFTVSLDMRGEWAGPLTRVDGPGQYAVVLSDEDQTLVHFQNFIDGHQLLD